MKTMKNFAAQQLTKTQMNEVKGGAVTCVNTGGSHTIVIQDTNDVRKVQETLNEIYNMPDYKYTCS